MQLINGAQFLNITPLLFSSACLAAVLGTSGSGSGRASPTLVIVPLTSMYASL